MWYVVLMHERERKREREREREKERERERDISRKSIAKYPFLISICFFLF